MSQGWRYLMALCTAILVLVFSSVGAHANCGNGIVEGGEECDGGPNLFVDGDPANATCTSGNRCYYQFTCCKFNCQYVGTPGVPCQDGNSCSGPDTCNQIGACMGGPNAANDTPCDDGLFCTGTETCQNGFCNVSTGNPCPGTACNICQEDTDSCFNIAGSACDDGNGCVTGGTCNGAGTCNGGSFSAGPCDDGLFCNGADTCGGGACSVHDGDPCTQSGDGDANCSESCNEDADLCTAADPNGSGCNDGLFCNGAADICDTGACTGTGTTACDDLNSCTTDTCDEGLDACTHPVSGDGVPCNDADPCSVDDVCAAGLCVGGATDLNDLCPWTMLLREGVKKDAIKINFQSQINGDVCGGTIRLSDFVQVSSDLVSGEDAGTGQLRLAPFVVVGDEIVSNGGGAKAYPGSGLLPYTSPPSSTVAPLAANGSYDLTGGNPLAAACVAARTGFPGNVAGLDGLTATTTLESVSVATATSFSINATVVGGLNVVDVTASVKVATDGELELNGGGSADTVMVLRVSGKFTLQLRSALSLTNGLTPEHTLIYVRGKKCLLADLSIGGGTMFCSPARLKTGRSVAWVGSLYGDGGSLKVGEKSSFQFTPFQGDLY